MSDWRGALARGQVIPAHPLALTNDRQLDERRQRALSRYYIAAGAGGLAVGVDEVADEESGDLAAVIEHGVDDDVETDKAGDVLGAHEVFMDAYQTDVRADLAAWREERGLPAYPMKAYAESGYQQQIEAARVGGTQLSWT